jgi:hypothetical protein
LPPTCDDSCTYDVSRRSCACRTTLTTIVHIRSKYSSLELLRCSATTWLCPFHHGDTHQLTMLVTTTAYHAERLRGRSDSRYRPERSATRLHAVPYTYRLSETC